MFRPLLLGLLLFPVVVSCSDNSEAKKLLAAQQAKQLFVPQGTTDKVQLPDGAVYEGEFKDGLFHGEGKLTWPNGDVYEGEFENGRKHGHGKETFANGDIHEGEYANGMAEGKGHINYTHGGEYTGEFKGGMFHGEGKYIAYGGTIYSGEFLQSRQEGNGKIIYKDRGTYNGQIKNWKMHGQGTYTTRGGKTVYSGQFENDSLTGSGEIKHKNGSHYKGEVKDWVAHGKGELRTKNGEFYKGEFRNNYYDGQGELNYVNGNTHKGTFKDGMRHGKGVFTRAKPKGRKKVELGWWEYDDYVGKEKPKKNKANYRKARAAKIDAESIYYSQPKKLNALLQTIKPSEKNKIDLYVVNFAAYGSQDVFMKEALYSKAMFDKHFNTQGRSLNLINNHKQANNSPLASVTNLDISLQKIAGLMDVKEDILFMYLTSHGSKKHGLNVSLRGVPLNDLPADRLAEMLKKSGIKWKVIVVSSCYSGGFIRKLKDDHTMIMTASKADHVSFGCSDEAEFTFFGRALLKHGIPDTRSFNEAFTQAKSLVTKWEKKENYDHSVPQVWSGKKITAYLKQWRQSLSNKIAIKQQVE